MPSYTRVVNSHNMYTNVGTPVFLNLCADCGAVVSSKEVHTAFHEVVNEQAAELVRSLILNGSHLALTGSEFCVCGHMEYRHERSTGMCAIIDPMCGCTGFKDNDDD